MNCLAKKVALSSCYVSAHVSLQLFFFLLVGKNSLFRKKKKKAARNNLLTFGRAKHNSHEYYNFIL